MESSVLYGTLTSVIWIFQCGVALETNVAVELNSVGPASGSIVRPYCIDFALWDGRLSTAGPSKYTRLWDLIQETVEDRDVLNKQTGIEC